MKIQRIPNARQQNFGDIIVLERGDNNSWENLGNCIADASQRKDSFVTDKGGILLSTGEERLALDVYTEFIKISRENGYHADAQAADTLLQNLIKKYAEIAKATRTFVIDTVDDLRKISIPGFEDLAQCAKNPH